MSLDGWFIQSKPWEFQRSDGSGEVHDRYLCVEPVLNRSELDHLSHCRLPTTPKPTTVKPTTPTKTTQKPTYSQCSNIWNENLIFNNAGEFETEEIIKENFMIFKCSIKIVEGYTGNGVRLYGRLKPRASLWYYFKGGLTVGTKYFIVAFIKVET